MGTFIMIVQFFLSLCLLIILHEWGHFAAARWFKTKVEKFYLFFDVGFSLFKKKIGDTEYGVGWLPLGGYVKIAGMIDESMDREQMKQPEQPWEFRAKPAWQRLIIMLGGVIVNFVLGFFIFAMMLWYWGESYIAADKVTDGIVATAEGQALGLQDGDKIIKVGDFPFEKFDPTDVVRHIIIDGARTITVNRNGQTVNVPVTTAQSQQFASADFKGKSLFELPYPMEIKNISPKSPAEAAGLQADDRLVAINGVPTPQAIQFLSEIKKHKSAEVTLDIIRNGQPIQQKLTTTENGTIGIGVKLADEFYDVSYEKYGFFQSFPAGIKKGIDILGDQMKAFGKMFSGEIKATESLGGPIAIATMFPKYWDAQHFWRMTAILSLILAFMNLLPIPALDGGHVMFLLWEMITGRKPSDKFLEVMTLIGFVILMGFMIFVFGNDIRRYFF